MERDLAKLKTLFVQENADDDFADKLSHSYSSMLLIFFAILISAKSFVGPPIQCWVPKHFKGGWGKYANNYCYINNTYYLPFEDHVPKEGEFRHTIPYYQWVPVFLLLMAAFFLLPYYTVWRRGSRRTGIRMPFIVAQAKILESNPLRDVCLEKVETEMPEDKQEDAASNGTTSDNDDDVKPSTSRDDSITSSASEETPPGEETKKEEKKKKPTPKEDARDEALDCVVYRIHRYLCRSRVHEEKHGYNTGLMRLACCRRIGKSRDGQFLTTLFIFTKFVYLINAVAQLFVLDVFLGQSFSMYGIEVMKSLYRGEKWTESPRFPRITQCDLNTRRVGNIHRYTVQCVLPNNLFNEKIFLIVWFWLVFVIAATLLGIFSAIMRNGFKGDRYRFLKRFFRRPHLQEELNRRLSLLPVPDRLVTKDRKKALELKEVSKFEKYLKTDGVFILRLLEDNTSTTTVSEILEALYKKHANQSVKQAIE